MEDPTQRCSTDAADMVQYKAGAFISLHVALVHAQLGSFGVVTDCAFKPVGRLLLGLLVTRQRR